MPELPEVETIRRDLEKYIVNKSIIKIRAPVSKVIQSPVRELRRTLLHNKINAIKRRGKLLVFCLEPDGQFLLIHLKMTGQLLYQERDIRIAGGHSQGQPFSGLPNRHTRLTITFADGAKLFFNDLRLFAYARLADKKQCAAVLKRYGVEPLSPAFTVKRLTNILRNKKKILKALLLDQEIIAGIGNIYADEACFAAGIHPRRRCHRLKSEEIKRLHRAIKKILRLAVKKRGTTFNNYVDGLGRTGSFTNYLKVYGRAEENCRCGRVILTKITVAGRGTVVCAVCQK
ncbi:MAG: DNA-formamidopyrimidine glycosylase [Candidatus Magasanikbacteria bacterium]|nr:DNA-formamidopyrimidine glycosylase [Candidatus Magasanikbacteria bacterium]